VFTRFSPAAKRVLRAAEQACRNHNHYYVGVGHLLLALLEERDAGVEARLAERGTHPADVLADVRRALGTGDDRHWDGILITPRVRSIVALAETAAPSGEPIEPAHLLDAIVLEGGGLAAEILARFQGAIGGHRGPSPSGGVTAPTSWR
jgi:ATP-dependent Clp protease ATP-binding subunit ClpA